MAWSVDELRERVREDPSGRFLLPLAEELLRRGETHEALETLDRGLARRGDHVAVRIVKARCLLDLDRPLDALSMLEEVLAADPLQMVAAKLLVEAAIRAGEAARAAEALAAYREMQPGDPALGSLEARIAARGDSSRREEMRETGARSGAGAREDELVTVTLGNLYLEQGHGRQAAEIFRRLLRGDPNNAAARTGLARAQVLERRAANRRRHDIVRESASAGESGRRSADRKES